MSIEADKLDELILCFRNLTIEVAACRNEVRRGHAAVEDHETRIVSLEDVRIRANGSSAPPPGGE